ncbi:Hcp family type VI secretion system effector [Jejubacter calystegiae]|uniref:Hcp family type VI secretion system effector n=1 Tax=Jejubacter calystegiae TaxID=2579935 RepID=A0A4P8YL46_9ENTR|nr:Hcp family type VI secretion system effector [Jejubacter calystegiae]QCT21469.1 Hcp family type VI secretion system effector [Jejubacter calystegiae]
MPIPAYMWLKDDGGADIKGSVDVQDREGSIEVVEFSHGLNIPVDSNTGKVAGTRSHSPVMIEKEFDSSSPYIYKAVSKGQTLQSAEIRWYRINHAGQEEAYFVMLFGGVKITGVNPGMPNAKLSGTSQINHMESVSMMYERVTWRYVDGNIQYTDDWNLR